MGTIWKTLLAGLGRLFGLLMLLALLAIPAVFLGGLYGYLPSLLLLCLGLLCALRLLILRHALQVEATAPLQECPRGSQIRLELAVHNRSPLICPRAIAMVEIPDLFGAVEARRPIPLALAGRGSTRLALELDMRHIGLYTVGLRQIELRDFLGLLRSKLPMQGQYSVCVTPRLRPVEALELSETLLTEAQLDTRVTAVGGMDYTGVREYIPGDPMKQIHWKLSAHSRSYMTRLQESNRQQEYAVILDFAAPGQPQDAELLMDLNDCLIETALSLLEEISQQEAAGSLLYADRNEQLAQAHGLSQAALPELLRSFAQIQPQPGPSFPDACQLLEQEGRRQNRAANVLVVTAHITPELVSALGQQQRSRRYAQLYYVYPAIWNQRQVEAATAPLLPLQQAEIPCFLVSTGAEGRATA